jgi:hypothetical protein
MIGFAAFIVILVAGILVLVGGLQWIGHRAEPLPPADAGRLDRLETALTALEGRVGELHEQQQFLERLISDRPDSPALESGPGASPGGVDSVLFDRDEAEEGGTR